MIKGKVLLLTLLVFLFSLSYANAGCMYDYLDWSTTGCDSGLSCCSVLDCVFGSAFSMSYGANDAYICVDSDNNLNAGKASCCDGGVQFLYADCNPSVPQGLECLNAWEDPCASNDYCGGSTGSTYCYTSTLATDWRCPDPYPGQETPFYKKMVNWDIFADERIFKLTSGDFEEGRTALHDPFYVNHGDALVTSGTCGDDVRYLGWPSVGSSERVEWYTECIPYFSSFGNYQENTAAVCNDDGSGQPSYACCDNAWDCVFNSNCYTTAWNSFYFVPDVTVSYGSFGSGVSEVRTNDISNDYEVCINSRWVDPDYLPLACQWVTGSSNKWVNKNNVKCEAVTRLGCGTTCVDNGVYNPDYFSNYYCCGDDEKEYLINYDGKTACCDKSTDIIDTGGNCQNAPAGECSGTPTSCGVYPNCVDCTLLDGCYNSVGTKGSGRGYKFDRDYSCGGTSCTFASDDCSGSQNHDNDSIACNCDCGGYDILEICDDGIDNDCDGYLDCVDSDCMGNPACPGGPCTVTDRYWSRVSNGPNPGLNLNVDAGTIVYLIVKGNSAANCNGQSVILDYWDKDVFVDDHLVDDLGFNLISDLNLRPSLTFSGDTINYPWETKWFNDNDFGEPNNDPDYVFKANLGEISNILQVLDHTGMSCSDIAGAQCCLDGCQSGYSTYPRYDSTCGVGYSCCDVCFNPLGCTDTHERDKFVSGDNDCNQCSNTNGTGDGEITGYGDQDGDQPGAWSSIGTGWQRIVDQCDSNCGVVATTVQLNDYQASENRCDGIDNDCDGTIDEGCGSNPCPGHCCSSSQGCSNPASGGPFTDCGSPNICCNVGCGGGGGGCDAGDPCDEDDDCYNEIAGTGGCVAICEDNGGVYTGECDEDCDCDCDCNNGLSASFDYGQCVDNEDGSGLGTQHVIVTYTPLSGAPYTDEYDQPCILEGDNVPFYDVFAVLLTIVVLISYYFFKNKKF